MIRRLARPLAIAAIALLATTGCATLLDVSAPAGDNAAGVGWLGWYPGGPSISGNGRFSVFTGRRSALDPTFEVFRHDALTGTTARVTEDADGVPFGGSHPAISRDGRFVAFLTVATLVPGDTNLQSQYGWPGTDVYVRDMVTGAFSLVSLEPDGGPFVTGGLESFQGSVLISADGRYVAFARESFQGRTSYSSIYVRDRTAPAPVAVAGGYTTLRAMSGDGLHVALDDHSTCSGSGPCPTIPGIRVVDWKAATTFQIDCDSGGAIGLSDDARYVAVTQAERPGCLAGLVRLDRHHPSSPKPFPVPVPPGSAPTSMAMSSDGARVAFATSGALLPEDTNGFTDVYTGDFGTGAVGIASRTALNGSADGNSMGVGLSADGRYVTFGTLATNLLAGDSDGVEDVIETPTFRPTPSPGLIATLAPGQTALLTVHGQGFSPETTVQVLGGGANVDHVTVLNGTRLDVTISIGPDASPGTRDLHLVTSGPYGDTGGFCFGCLTVT